MGVCQHQLGQDQEVKQGKIMAEQTEKPKTNKSLDHRRDYRSVERFAQDIATWTKRENIWAEVLKAEFEEHGYEVEIKDHGIDGDGKLIEHTGKKIKNLDKKFYLNGVPYFVEIKTCDMGKDYVELPFITLKTSTMINTISVEGRIVIVDRNWWMILRTDCLKKLLKGYDHKIYRGFSPNDLAIRVPAKELKEKWLTTKKTEDKIEARRWSKRSRLLIKKFEKKLFREKE